MYLVDSNVWLERLLDQEKSNEVGQFLDIIPSDQLCLTDFAFHSIAVILCRLRKQSDLGRFVQDVFVDGAVDVLGLAPTETQAILTCMAESNFDFDDAYQYAIAEKHDLTIVSFDTDFDRTPRGRTTPAAIITRLKSE